MAEIDPQRSPAPRTMMLLDSNILIYAALGENDAVVKFVERNAPLVSDISRVEVLGFHRITTAEVEFLNAFFASTTPIAITDGIINEAIKLRQQRKMTLGDSLIAATALTNSLTLVTRNTKDFKWIEALTLIDPLKD